MMLLNEADAIYLGSAAAAAVYLGAVKVWPEGVSEGSWMLVGSWIYSSDVAHVDFTGLAGYTEVRVLLRLVASTLGSYRRLQVSTDNGLTFLISTGDYIEIASNGAGFVASSIPLASTISSAARSGEILITGWNLTAPKNAQLRHYTTGSRHHLIPSVSPLNALRISDVAELTSGSIYVFART